MQRLAGKRWVLGATVALLSVTACDDQANTVVQPTVKPIEMLSVDGIGPINGNTPFNLHDITMAFQGLNVAQRTNYAEGQEYPTITVSQDLKPLLSINPDAKHEKVFSVMVHDNLIGNGLGHALGSRFNEVYAYGATEECRAGAEELSGKVLCYAPKTGNVLYLFGGTWNGPDGSVPPKDVLANWQMEAMIWKPPAN
ncbi:DUF1131 family protein [Thiothrix subterranea]|uniref:DUF1131 family protein n=1 Tax=Thiothrix subterranea TaxID=2735563 RepID=A0AA51MME3_9GAMM|nr:DUF1131 family protein [Thiothrix subterranea]MDQ5770469.1 DUF1131 family protein [Thiothrix subterranea]WML86853.1 DUF1131 family protein [Thiothrix subterranea]